MRSWHTWSPPRTKMLPRASELPREQRFALLALEETRETRSPLPIEGVPRNRRSCDLRRKPPDATARSLCTRSAARCATRRSASALARSASTPAARRALFDPRARFDASINLASATRPAKVTHLVLVSMCACTGLSVSPVRIDARLASRDVALDALCYVTLRMGVGCLATATANANV
ncbi:MAG: hypothetical protein SGPRY_007266 [Prymnesium sp.]